MLVVVVSPVGWVVVVVVGSGSSSGEIGGAPVTRGEPEERKVVLKKSKLAAFRLQANLIQIRFHVKYDF